VLTAPSYVCAAKPWCSPRILRTEGAVRSHISRAANVGLFRGFSAFVIIVIITIIITIIIIIIIIIISLEVTCQHRG
jgi:hypothetical protein